MGSCRNRLRVFAKNKEGKGKNTEEMTKNTEGMTNNKEEMVKNTDAKAKNTEAKAIVSDAKAFARLFLGGKREAMAVSCSYSFPQRVDGLPQMISNIQVPAPAFLPARKNCSSENKKSEAIYGFAF